MKIKATLTKLNKEGYIRDWYLSLPPERVIKKYIGPICYGIINLFAIMFGFLLLWLKVTSFGSSLDGYYSMIQQNHHHIILTILQIWPTIEFIAIFLLGMTLVVWGAREFRRLISKYFH